MFNTQEQEEIVRFCTSSDERKRLALAIIAAQNTIRRALIDEFVRDLTNRLHEATHHLGPEWIVVDGWSTKHRDLGLSKKLWNGIFKIVIQPDHKISHIKFGIGVWNESYHDRDRAKNAFNRLRSSRQGEEAAGDNWPYCFAVKSDYQNWDAPVDLERLTVGNDALDYFLEETVSLARDSESIIDDLMQHFMKSSPPT